MLGYDRDRETPSTTKCVLCTVPFNIVVLSEHSMNEHKCKVDVNWHFEQLGK